MDFPFTASGFTPRRVMSPPLRPHNDNSITLGQAKITTSTHVMVINAGKVTLADRKGGTAGLLAATSLAIRISLVVNDLDQTGLL